ncbi:MAG: Twitching mobility protein [candidate division WS6 bacterium OLB20]|uniref:Twitching mobility protein n=1 Tax=candidate division WS6 bacterium OLB20 TaxID=1617426 RepID=A0A136LY63_9BACT|nr:MAG: Twitching mobility protein [candidate division WS6 bacterium OLB20]
MPFIDLSSPAQTSDPSVAQQPVTAQPAVDQQQTQSAPAQQAPEPISDPLAMGATDEQQPPQQMQQPANAPEPVTDMPQPELAQQSQQPEPAAQPVVPQMPEAALVPDDGMQIATQQTPAESVMTVDNTAQASAPAAPLQAPAAAVNEAAPADVTTPAAAMVPEPELQPQPSAQSASTSLPPLPDNGTQSQKVELSGSAQGKEDQVAQILQKADQLTETKQKQKSVQQSDTVGLKPKDASEDYYAQRASMDDFLALAEERGASDLHMSTGYPPMLRVDGKLMPIGSQILQFERVQTLLYSIISDEQKKSLETDLDIDFSHSIQSGTRFRVNMFHKKGQLAGAFRLIPSRIRTIAELGLPEVMYEFAKLPHGLVLVTGPTGHGKSTTLASIIQEINVTEAQHIITIEDPIEYVFPRAKSLVDQREVGTDVTSFTRALRAALREDPDVVLVGEMRDFETIASAITVAETGHLVFSTLHTNSAAQSIDRMIDVFPEQQQAQIRAQLANVIAAVVAQRLVPIQGGGRKAVLEIMIANAAIKNAIREGKTYQIDNMIQTSAELGMIPLEKSLIKLVRSGDLTIEEAQTYTTKPDELLQLMKSNTA